MHSRTKILLGTLVVLTAMAILGHMETEQDSFDMWARKYQKNYAG